MNTVLGGHVGTGSRDGYGLTAPHFRGIVVFDGGGSMDEISEDCFRLYRPNNLYEWPPGSGGGLDDIMPGFDQIPIEEMEAQANYWWPIIKQRTDEIAEIHGRVDATKPTNEVAGNDPAQLRKLVEFEKHLGHLAAEEEGDYVLTMGNCATNSPHWDEGLWQEIIAPHIIEMWGLGHIYCRHAYADRVGDQDRLIVDGEPAGDSSGRPFREIEYFKDTFGFCGGIILGEIGFVSYPGDEPFMREITAYDEYMRQYPEIGYGAIFEYGDWNTGRANIETASASLALWLEMYPFTKWTPQDPPPPVDPEREKHVSFKIAQEHTEDEWADLARIAYQNYKRSMTASHTACINEVQSGNGESYAIIVDPHLPSQAETAALLDSLRLTWVPYNYRDDHTDSPLVNLSLGHLFNWQYAYTSEFDAPRPAYEGEHEGRDADLVGGYADNRVDVLCVYDGVVTRSENRGTAYGEHVIVRSENNGSVFFIWYCHLDDRKVSVGDTVRVGDGIGEVGDTGGNWNEHIHINLQAPGYGLDGYVVSDVVDPAPYMPTNNMQLPPLVVGSRFNITDWVVGTNMQQFDMDYGSGTQTTMISHQPDGSFLYVKGTNGEYERLWIGQHNGEDWVFRADDTSESPDRMYAHYEERNGALGAPWIPCNPVSGRWYDTNKYVQHYLKDGCVPQNGGQVTDRIRLLSAPYTRTYPLTGQSLQVITLQWSSGEEYDFAGGNVGFRKSTGENFEFMGWLHGREPLPILKHPCFGW